MKANSNKALSVITICFAMLCGSRSLLADDYKSAHRVEPGDLISADMINELFDNIEDSKKVLTEDDLLGTWRGTFYGSYGSPTPEWQTESNGLFQFLTNATITFTKDTTGVYRVSSSMPHPFVMNDSAAISSVYAIRENALFLHGAACPVILDFMSPTRMRLTPVLPFSNYSRMGRLDKQNLPPGKPKLVAAIHSHGGVVLSWTDQSNDETGFSVLRRDELSGIYSNVFSVASNVCSYTNTVPSSGIYWYRIAATNACGSSVGSNVKRVVVP